MNFYTVGRRVKQVFPPRARAGNNTTVLENRPGVFPANTARSLVLILPCPFGNTNNNNNNNNKKMINFTLQKHYPRIPSEMKKRPPLINFITPVNMVGNRVVPLLPLVHQVLAAAVAVQLERVCQRRRFEVRVVDAHVRLLELLAVRVGVPVQFNRGFVDVGDVQLPGGCKAGEEEESGDGGSGELHADNV
jgi:hypothetical protein